MRPPWQPGQSGNALGNHKNYRAVLKLARANSVPAMQAIIDLLKDEDPRMRLQAATAILERAYGKPKEHHDFSGLGEGNQIVIVTGVPDTQQVAEETITISLAPDDEQDTEQS